jgi:hypothetical protein
MLSNIQFNPIYSHHTPLTFPIENYTIFGERHSGTNWLERLINIRLNLSIINNFGDNTSKHFIRYIDWKLLSNSHKTLFICITRNIYDWIHGFYKLPHHVSGNICDSMENFLTKEWKNEERDYDFISLKPYNNIFEMRKSKLYYYYNYLPILVDNLLIIRYEDLLVNPENIIDFISNNFNCIKTTRKYVPMILPKQKKLYKVKDHIRQIINSSADWEAENLFQYHMISSLSQ